MAREKDIDVIISIAKRESKVWTYTQLLTSFKKETLTKEPDANEGTVKKRFDRVISDLKKNPEYGLLFDEDKREYHYQECENIIKDELPKDDRARIMELLHKAANDKKQQFGESFDRWLKITVQRCVNRLLITDTGDLLFNAGFLMDITSLKEQYNFFNWISEGNINLLDWYDEIPSSILSSLLTHPDIKDQAWKYYDIYREKRIEEWKKHHKKKGGLFSR